MRLVNTLEIASSSLTSFRIPRNDRGKGLAMTHSLPSLRGVAEANWSMRFLVSLGTSSAISAEGRGHDKQELYRLITIEP